MRELSFDFMHFDKVCCHVEVDKHGNIDYQQYTDSLFESIFFRGEPSIERLLTFFRSRCFEETRADADEWLRYLGLKEYDPLEICRKTHGRMWGDKLWIRFKGEDICFNDVRGPLDN